MAWFWWLLWVWVGVLVVALVLNVIVALIQRVIDQRQEPDTIIDLRGGEEPGNSSERGRQGNDAPRRKTHHLRTR